MRQAIDSPVLVCRLTYKVAWGRIYKKQADTRNITAKTPAYSDIGTYFWHRFGHGYRIGSCGILQGLFSHDAHQIDPFMMGLVNFLNEFLKNVLQF